MSLWTAPLGTPAPIGSVSPIWVSLSADTSAFSRGLKAAAQSLARCGVSTLEATWPVLAIVHDYGPPDRGARRRRRAERRRLAGLLRQAARS